MSNGNEVVVVNFAILVSPEFRESLYGAEIARIATIALFALLLFEYALTFDDERRHFWNGPFTISHGLFFFNRYVPLIILMIGIVCSTIANPTANFCEATIQMSFLLSLVAVCVIEAILLTRVWCLFPGSLAVKIGLVAGFLITIILSLVFLFLSANDLQIFLILPDPRLLFITGCRASRPDGFWRIYLPSLILHTAIYALTVYRAATKVDNSNEDDGLRKRLLTDGGVFYFTVLFTVGFTSIGSFLTNVPEINIPSIFSPVVLATTSIATTRIMFSLREETAHLATIPQWFVLFPAVPASSDRSRRSSMTKIGPTESYLHV